MIGQKLVCIVPTRFYTQSAKVDFDLWPMTQNQEGLSSNHEQLTCEVWKWSGKNCSLYRVHKEALRTHPHTRTLTHSLIQPHTNGPVTISPPTLLGGNNNMTRSIYLMSCTKFVFFGPMGQEDGPGLWLAETFPNFPLQLLNRIWWKLTGGKYSTSSAIFPFFSG